MVDASAMPRLIWSARFVDHVTPPGHPERAARAEVMEVVARRWADAGCALIDPRPATRESLARVHIASYLDRIAATAGLSLALDADTFTSPDSHEVARLAAGAAIDAADLALDGHGPACALVRPPGHHAERDRAMGFCLYNNVAVATAHALARGADRVAIVDYDVHHGNGTQWIFYDDPRVLYVSIHQHPFYPGTGAADEMGRGAGVGFTVNVPLAAGCTDADYAHVFETIVGPVLDRYRPDLVLVSAGFDAHLQDPLGGMRLTAAGFAWMTWCLRESARASARGALALVTEGGYDLHAFAESLSASIEALSGTGAPPTEPDAGDRTGRSAPAITAARTALAPFWPDL